MLKVDKQVVLSRPRTAVDAAQKTSFHGLESTPLESKYVDAATSSINNFPIGINRLPKNELAIQTDGSLLHLRKSMPNLAFSSRLEPPPEILQGELKLKDTFTRCRPETPRAVSRFRHLRECTGNLGDHIVFVDGAVKIYDCYYWPPTGDPALSSYRQTTHRPIYHPPRFDDTTFSFIEYPKKFRQNSATPSPRRVRTGAKSQMMGEMTHLDRVRSGFKYWFDDRKKPPLTPTTVYGRLVKTGLVLGR